MPFKKDYINFVLHTVVTSREGGFNENYRLRKLVDSIMSIDDVMKVTYLVGKTAGLEGLFKYMLYVSDKIDKSQVTIFTLKDNFDYDVKNLIKICEKISRYKSESVQEALENIKEEMDLLHEDTEETLTAEPERIIEHSLEMVDDSGEQVEEDKDDSGDSKLTLIENKDSLETDAEVFELESISDSVENPELSENKTDNLQEEVASDEIEEISTDEDIIEETSEETGTEETGTEEAGTEETGTEEAGTEETGAGETSAGEIIEEIRDETVPEEIPELDTPLIEEFTANDPAANDPAANDPTADEPATDELVSGSEKPDKQQGKKSKGKKLPEIEIEVHKPVSNIEEEKHVKEETITNEAYYKFETKFFEEVKILEKLFAAVDKDCKTDESGKLSEKCLQCLTEIIEITSELSSLARQLSFDLIADIFLTMNLYFTKAISQPETLTSERIKLFDSALALVNSLIKGEDYLNYDTIVDKIEKLKADMSGEKDEKYPAEEAKEDSPSEKEYAEAVQETTQPIIRKTTIKPSQMESAVFKLKYLVKEFEKSFNSIGDLQGEYSKFDALEKINELNNSLRMIAKISTIVKLNEVLKLAEVTYVFLKYVKDYRMDLMEPEIKQIVKYIIFTFKMLLTNRKPEDFNVLVQHLNNPVKIFADS